MLSLDEYYRFLRSMRNTDFEPGYDEYIKLLPRLNKICYNNGGNLEGNLFYASAPDFEYELCPPPEPRFRKKRRDFAGYVMGGSNMLEIGFNAGHSALLALCANQHLKYSGVDYGNHPYTVPCFNYLKEFFGSRISLRIGDSRDVIPTISPSEMNEFDLFHIDGGHSFEVCYKDLSNIISVAKSGSVILLDDTNSGVSEWFIDEIADLFIMRGLVTRQFCSRLWQSDQHVLLLVN